MFFWQEDYNLTIMGYKQNNNRNILKWNFGIFNIFLLIFAFCCDTFVFVYCKVFFVVAATTIHIYT